MDFRLNLNSELVSAAYPVDPLAVERNTPVRDILAMMKNQGIGSVLICRNGVLEGIFTERDALQLMADGANFDVPIASVMVADPITIQEDETVSAAIRKMASGGYRRLPIVDEGGRPQGVLKVSGIVRYLVEHFPQTVYNLPPEPNPVMQQREGA